MPGLSAIAKAGAPATLALLGITKPEEAEAAFGGQLAKKASQKLMYEARDRLLGGANPNEVFKHTGWYRDPVDGHMKFEIKDPVIYDEPLSSDSMAIIRQGGETNLGDLLRHDKFFENYPDLRDTIVLKEKNPKYNGSVQSMGPGAPSVMSLRTERPIEDIYSTLLHENQHLVQDFEMFPSGGTPSQFRTNIAGKKPYDDAWNALLAKKLGLENYYNDFLKHNPTGDARKIRKEIDELHEEMKDLDFERYKFTPDHEYRRLAGESEARAVQNRNIFRQGSVNIDHISPQQHRPVYDETTEHLIKASDSPMYKGRRPAASLASIAAFNSIPGMASSTDNYSEMLPPEYPTLLKIGNMLDKVDTPIGNPIGGVADYLKFLGYQGFDAKNKHSEVQERSYPEALGKAAWAGLDLL